jgi:hypothetical protein
MVGKNLEGTKIMFNFTARENANLKVIELW